MQTNAAFQNPSNSFCLCDRQSWSFDLERFNANWTDGVHGCVGASWSEEKSHGTDDATVRASPVRVGGRWLTTSNGRQSKLVLDARGSATGHATPIVTREPTESFDMSLPCLEVRRSERARAAVTMRILLVSAASLASGPR